MRRHTASHTDSIRKTATTVVFFLALALSPSSAPADGPPPLYKARPIIKTVAQITADDDQAAVSDVEAADFDGDGRVDIAVAWFITDLEDIDANQRFLTIYYNNGATLQPETFINLYIADHYAPAYSIFRIGTGDIGVGDFDGDADLDLAVGAFFGDEIWFIENLGRREYEQHLKFPFMINSAGNFLTPPEMLAADFNDDGRDELVYIADPEVHIGARHIHFWSTTGTIANIARIDWHAQDGGIATRFTRALTVTDFDDDRRPDLCYSGCTGWPYEIDPIVTWWHDLRVSSQRFRIANEFPIFACSDVVHVRPHAAGPAGVIFTDLHGTEMQYWRRLETKSSSIDYELAAWVTGYAGLSPNRGMTAVIADVDLDGDPDLVTKQKLGTATDRNQIEITLSSHGGNTWTRMEPTPIDTRRLANETDNPLLRPRNLAVADLLGNRLPEIIAGFGPDPITDPSPGDDLVATLDIAIWLNGCLGDVNRDDQVNGADAARIVAALASQPGQPHYNANADLNRDAIVNTTDLLMMLNDFGCRCAACTGLSLADTDCNGIITPGDIDAFVVALEGEDAYQQVYPDCRWLNADCNGDLDVNWQDIDVFIAVLSAHVAVQPAIAEMPTGSLPVLKTAPPSFNDNR